MHYFTKDQAETLAKQDRDWTVKKSNQYDNLYIVWSNRSEHYVEFSSEVLTRGPLATR